MHRYVPVAAAFFAIFASGCVINVSDDSGGYVHRDARAKESRNRDLISQLDLGASIEQVLVEFGEPDFSEAWLKQGQEVRVLRYRTHRANADGDTTPDETTPLVFRAGKLVGIGERAVSDS